MSQILELFLERRKGLSPPLTHFISSLTYLHVSPLLASTSDRPRRKRSLRYPILRPITSTIVSLSPPPRRSVTQAALKSLYRSTAPQHPLAHAYASTAGRSCITLLNSRKPGPILYLKPSSLTFHPLITLFSLPSQNHLVDQIDRVNSVTRHAIEVT